MRTLLGPRPIESLRVGDRVLTENPTSGALNFQPVVAIAHNPPTATLRLKFDQEDVVTTPIHRFWRVGRGWVMARDLKPGDMVRTLGGLSSLTGVEWDVVRPVFNLEVAEGHSFFVGQRGALVHDNSEIRPSSAPFDAAPRLAAIARSRK